MRPVGKRAEEEKGVKREGERRRRVRERSVRIWIVEVRIGNGGDGTIASR